MRLPILVYNILMRKIMIAGNWKMHMTSTQTEALIHEIKEHLDGREDADIVIAPPFTSLASAKSAIGTAPIKLSAQNIFWEEKGAFTGEISPTMLTEIGCQFVIIGHSERRQHFGENDLTVNKRLNSALDAGLFAIVCIGESLDDREDGRTEEVLEKQLAGGFDSINADSLSNITIAYEPVWAIGTGKTATPRQAEDTHKFIRGWLEKKYGEAVAQAVRILYGGSVKPGNASELLALENVDGALVGGASLKADDFCGIIRNSL